MTLDDELSPEEEVAIRLQEFFKIENINHYMNRLLDNGFDVLDGMNFLETYSAKDWNENKMYASIDFYYQLYSHWGQFNYEPNLPN